MGDVVLKHLRCAKCGRNIDCADGLLNPLCVDCWDAEAEDMFLVAGATRSREYYSKHREQEAARVRLYYWKHREANNAKCRKYYAENREAILSKRKECYWEHRLGIYA